MTLPTTSGLHHISAMARDPQRNVDVYQHVLGQRLIKTAVNFDDPSTHHLYYGDGRGTLGTALTFFPWPIAARGTRGTGETDAIQYAVPTDSIAWWRERLDGFGFALRSDERFGEPVLAFEDPDGTPLELVGTDEPPWTAPWPAGPIPVEHRLRGFHGVTLALADARATAALLVRMGYAEQAREGARTRFVATRTPAAQGAAGDASGAGGAGGEATGASRSKASDASTSGAPARGIGTHIDLLEIGHRLPSRYGAGSIHHIAFRVEDDAAQRQALEALRADGLGVSDVRERVYFRSIYAREPGGVLFEFATDGPGFDVDESVDELGSALRLPPWYEPRRAEIEAKLPTLERDPMRRPDLDGARGPRRAATSPTPTSDETTRSASRGAGRDGTDASKPVTA